MNRLSSLLLELEAVLSDGADHESMLGDDA